MNVDHVIRTVRRMTWNASLKRDIERIASIARQRATVTTDLAARVDWLGQTVEGLERAVLDLHALLRETQAAALELAGELLEQKQRIANGDGSLRQPCWKCNGDGCHCWHCGEREGECGCDEADRNLGECQECLGVGELEACA